MLRQVTRPRPPPLPPREAASESKAVGVYLKVTGVDFELPTLSKTYAYITLAYDVSDWVKRTKACKFDLLQELRRRAVGRMFSVVEARVAGLDACSFCAVQLHFDVFALSDVAALTDGAGLPQRIVPPHVTVARTTAKASADGIAAGWRARLCKTLHQVMVEDVIIE